MSMYFQPTDSLKLGVSFVVFNHICLSFMQIHTCFYFNYINYSALLIFCCQYIATQNLVEVRSLRSKDTAYIMFQTI